MTDLKVVSLEQALAAREEPLPLFPPLPPAEPYPVDALGPVLSSAAAAIARKVQVPPAMAAQSVLAAAALAAQGHADVMLPYGQPRPLSLYLVTVAASGDRKSTADNEALWPVRKHEKALKEQHDLAHETWTIAQASWNAERKKIEGVEDRVFEAISEHGRVVGYYEIGNESMDALANKPDDYTKNYTAFPAVHLGFLGVHREFQRSGIGTALLTDAFDKVFQISDLAGMYALTLQSLDKDSTAFYKSLGFAPYSDHPTAPKMLIPVRTIRELVEAYRGR